MASRPLDLEPPHAPRTGGEIVHVDFGARTGDAASGSGEDAGGGFPFALLAAGVAGGLCLGVAVWAMGAPGWAAALIGWLSPAVLTPVLPLLPVLGEAFLAAPALAAAPAAPAGTAEVVAHPRAADLARWDADLAAERSAATGGLAS